MANDDPKKYKSRSRPCTVVAVGLATFALIALTRILDAHMFRDFDSTYRCRMTWMFPDYLRMDAMDKATSQRLADKFSLFLYKERTGFDVTDKPNGFPVIFVPGNAGSYKQIRSLGSVSSVQFRDTKTRLPKFDFFSIDTAEQFTAFSGSVLEDQSEYLNDVIRFVRSLYRNSPSVILVGHSMGGIVVRHAISQANYAPGSVAAIWTLGTPHLAPPVNFDPHMDAIVDAVNRFWQDQYHWLLEGSNTTILADISLISIAGGRLDRMIDSSLTEIGPIFYPASGKTSLEERELELHSEIGFTVYSTSIPGVWSSSDHRQILWCNQLMNVVARSLSDVVTDGKVLERQKRLAKLREIFGVAGRLDDRRVEHDYPIRIDTAKSIRHPNDQGASIQLFVDDAEPKLIFVPLNKSRYSIVSTHPSPIVRPLVCVGTVELNCTEPVQFSVIPRGEAIKFLRDGQMAADPVMWFAEISLQEGESLVITTSQAPENSGIENLVNALDGWLTVDCKEKSDVVAKQQSTASRLTSAPSADIAFKVSSLSTRVVIPSILQRDADWKFNMIIESACSTPTLPETENSQPNPFHSLPTILQHSFAHESQQKIYIHSEKTSVHPLSFSLPRERRDDPLILQIYHTAPTTCEFRIRILPNYLGTLATQWMTLGPMIWTSVPIHYGLHFLWMMITRKEGTLEGSVRATFGLLPSASMLLVAHYGYGYHNYSLSNWKVGLILLILIGGGAYLCIWYLVYGLQSAGASLRERVRIGPRRVARRPSLILSATVLALLFLPTSAHFVLITLVLFVMPTAQSYNLNTTITVLFLCLLPMHVARSWGMLQGRITYMQGINTDGWVGLFERVVVTTGAFGGMIGPRISSPRARSAMLFLLGLFACISGLFGFERPYLLSWFVGAGAALSRWAIERGDNKQA
ncbi:PGAP1-like protein-domain-containing protein [Cladochytrium replicatum]|nr:PGAP1-like protein-domain-containing protein [Cladochytrium replicatum]